MGPVERRCGPTRRTRLRYDGAERRIAAADRAPAWWRRTEALFPPAPPPGFDGYLVCAAPLRAVRMVVACARGAPVIADTSEAYASAGALAAFAGVDVFAPSMDEAALLTGAEDPETAALALRAVAPVVVLKRGRDGLDLFDAAGRLRHAVEPVEAVDPTGAGDAAVGALAASILLGEPPARQLDRAAEAGRLAIACAGPSGLGLTP